MHKEDVIKDKHERKEGHLATLNYLYQQRFETPLESFGKYLIDDVEKSNRPPFS